MALTCSASSTWVCLRIGYAPNWQFSSGKWRASGFIWVPYFQTTRSILQQLGMHSRQLCTNWTSWLLQSLQKTGPSGSFSGGRGRGRLSHFMTSEQPAPEVSQHGSYIPFLLFELHFHDFYWLCRLPLSCSCHRKHMKTAVLQCPLIDHHLQLLFEIKHNLFEFTSLSMSPCSWTRLSLPLSRLAGSGGGSAACSACSLGCIWRCQKWGGSGCSVPANRTSRKKHVSMREQFQKASSLILQSTLRIPNQWLFKASATHLMSVPWLPCPGPEAMSWNAGRQGSRAVGKALVPHLSKYPLVN